MASPQRQLWQPPPPPAANRRCPPPTPTPPPQPAPTTTDTVLPPASTPEPSLEHKCLARQGYTPVSMKIKKIKKVKRLKRFPWPANPKTPAGWPRRVAVAMLVGLSVFLV